MKCIQLCILLIFFSTHLTWAQLNDNFNDGDFSANPAWSGNSADWIISPTFQLQSNNTTANSNFYISTPNLLATVAQWEFYVKLGFNTSALNYVDIYLTASAADLFASTTTGYFVRLGGLADEISLFRKNANGSADKIIDGTDAVLNNSSNALKIKVTRDANNLFTVFRDLTGTGNSYISEGAVIEATLVTSAFFGIAVKQSTPSFFQRHFFDDIEIKTYTPDINPPSVVSATAISNNEVDVLFNEPVDNISGQVAANYVAGNSIGAALSAAVDAVNTALIHLTFGTNFPNGNSTLTVNGVQDLAGNTASVATATFYIYTPQQYDIVIDELIADPTPQVGLPNNEWIELKNTAAFPINIRGWRIGDASGLSGPLPDFELQPDSFVIVCTGSALPALSAFGKTLTVSSFPSMDNIGELIYLQSTRGQVIHSVQYNVAWYQNELKQDGGWSLEMVDTKNPCGGSSNWKASSNLKGGTPGIKNSEDNVNTDVAAPQLIRTYATDSLNIVLVFNEPLDSFNSAVAAKYNISDGIGVPVSSTCMAPGFTKIILRLASPILQDKTYTASVQNITDCAGNLIGTKKTAKVGLSKVADSLDLVINEILFNPPANGYDYVELYNKSSKIIDLNQTYIANRNTAGITSSITQLSAEPFLLFPEEFMVVTENSDWVKKTFVSQNLEAFIPVASMPTFNDDAGDVILLNGQGKITDEVVYSDKWHFKLLDNTEGVALERIDYNAASADAGNWHSAATSIGYGTPSYKNSQFKINDGLQGDVKISPEIVSPDNDGMDDFATIDYNFPEPGYIANITVFDAAGRPVKFLQRNALCGTKGGFKWDGLGEKNQPLSTGVYIVVADVFNLKGQKKLYKVPVVLAKRN